MLSQAASIYMVNKETQTGYFPDIYRIMRKFGLSEYFEFYIRFKVFPSKNIWKRLVTSQLRSILGTIDCLLLILIVSDSCTLIKVHILYRLNQRSPVIYSQK